MSGFKDLFGTTKTKFQVGLGATASVLKSIAGGFAIRNAGDSADAGLTASILRASGNSLILNSDGADTGVDRVLTLSLNPAATQSYEMQFPPAKGTDGYVLRQKAGTAAGVVELEFAASASTSACKTDDTTTIGFGSSSPIAAFSLPAAAVVHTVNTIIDTPFNGTNPTLSVGVTGTLAKYQAATENDLTAAAATSFETSPNLPAAGSIENIIITLAAGAATAGSARVIVTFSIPS